MSNQTLEHLAVEAVASGHAAAERLAARSLPEGLLHLIELLAQGAPQGDEGGSRLATLLAEMLEADFCCVVVRDRGAKDRLRIGVTVPQRPLSIAARRALIRGSSVVRQLLADGAGPATGTEPLRETRGERHTLTVPVTIDGIIDSVLHLRRDGPQVMPFSDAQATLARLVAVLIGDAQHLARLRGLLRSNYAQLALIQGGPGGSGAGATLPVALADADGMARRIAASFYRELCNAGFDERRIIAAASEVISHLGDDLRLRRSTRAAAT
jgi:L-methionine (R)-S-oxide reductase